MVPIDTSGPDATIDIEEKEDEAVILNSRKKKKNGKETDKTETEEKNGRKKR